MKPINELDFLTQLLKDHSEGSMHLELREDSKKAVVNVTKKTWKENVRMFYDES